MQPLAAKLVELVRDRWTCSGLGEAQAEAVAIDRQARPDGEAGDRILVVGRVRADLQAESDAVTHRLAEPRIGAAPGDLLAAHVAAGQ